MSAVSTGLVTVAGMKTCSFEGCTRESKYKKKDLCQAHYQQQRNGKELTTLQVDLPVVERFMKRVEKTDSCWLWTGSITSLGYGKFQIGTKSQAAHRASYELLVGAIDEGAVIHHTCSVRNCVNPSHLQAVSQASNLVEMLERKALKARIAELEAENAELRQRLES